MEIEVSKGGLVEFTPKQRKVIYSRALNEFEYLQCGPFLCNVLTQMLVEFCPKIAEQHQYRSSQELVEDYFPEFWTSYTSHAEFGYIGEHKNYIPFDKDFKGNNQRREVLIEAMEIMTHKKVYLPC